MKVSFIAGTLGRGGAERQLAYMLRALKIEGILSRVICLTKGEAFEREIREMGVDVDWVGSSRNNFARLGKIIRHLKKNPVDIVQSAHFYTNIYTALAGRISGVRTIGAIRNDLTSEIAANHVFGKWHLKLPQKLIANSQLAVERAIEKGIRPDNIDLVRNVVAIKKENVMPYSTNKERIKILFVGRLVPQKRPELFIETAARLSQRLVDKNLEFTIVGDGPLRRELEVMARERGLESDRLKFIGETSETFRFYESSDILVLTSGHEGTPNVILEAMEFGLPVVATNVGGVPEVVNDRCGILVDPTDTEKLMLATEKLILDENMRRKMGDEGQAYVRKNHSIDYLKERLTSIYSKIMSSAGLEPEHSPVGKIDQTA